MYFVIWVFPSSITSGVLPAASVASNFCRLQHQLWYCTLTVAPVDFSNAALAALTIGVQLAAFASSWSQTVMLLALVAPETPPAAIANTSAARATKPTATIFRPFIDEPSIALAGLVIAPVARRLGSADWLVPLAIPREGCHTIARMSRPLVHFCRPHLHFTDRTGNRWY